MTPVKTAEQHSSVPAEERALDAPTGDRPLRQALAREAAARALWAKGLPADAVASLREGLAMLATALPAGSGATTGPHQKLAERSSKVQRILQAAPALDGNVTVLDPAVDSWFAEALEVSRQTATLLKRAGRTPRQRLRIRVTLALVVAATVGACVAIGLWMRNPRVDVKARASGYFDYMPRFLPDHVADGQPRTEWVAPNRSTAWVEIVLPRPTDISGVRLINGANRPYHDRAILRFTVRITDRLGRRRHVTSSFPRFVTRPQPVIVPIQADDVVEVRLIVNSYYRRGAALAEMAVVPR